MFWKKFCKHHQLWQYNKPESHLFLFFSQNHLILAKLQINTALKPSFRDIKSIALVCHRLSVENNCYRQLQKSMTISTAPSKHLNAVYRWLFGLTSKKQVAKHCFGCDMQDPIPPHNPICLVKNISASS